MLIVRGATLAGLAASVRLARLGHEVTLITDGAALDLLALPPVIAMPAAWRDLFKKSGGHLQTELNRADVELVEAPAKTHSLPDGSLFALPSDRGAQYRAIAERFSPAEGARWRSLIDDLDDLWHAYRRHALEGITPVTTLKQRKELWLDTSVSDLMNRVGPELGSVVLDAGAAPDAPAIEALALSVERRFGRWQVQDASGDSQPSSVLVELLVRRAEERGVTFATHSSQPPDLDATVPEGPLRSTSATQWLSKPPIRGVDGALRASKASPAGPEPWAELSSAALAVYELHEQLTGQDCRPTNIAFTMPRLRPPLR